MTQKTFINIGTYCIALMNQKDYIYDAKIFMIKQLWIKRLHTICKDDFYFLIVSYQINSLCEDS
jgi:hypothetical protein